MWKVLIAVCIHAAHPTLWVVHEFNSWEEKESPAAVGAAIHGITRSMHEFVLDTRRGVSQRLIRWMTCMTLLSLRMCLWYLASMGLWWGEHCIYVRQRVAFRKQHWIWTLAMKAWSLAGTWGPPKRAVLGVGEVHPDSLGTARHWQASQVPNTVKQPKHAKPAKRGGTETMQGNICVLDLLGADSG